MKRKIGKLFGVLVVGGSMMAYGGEPVSPQETKEKEEERKNCQLEMVLSNSSHFKPLCPDTILCLDDKSDEEILETVEKERKYCPDFSDGTNCATPFCGCWLG